MNTKKAETNQIMQNTSQPDRSINILVLGDWVIDEDWVMMPERSETSAKQSDERHFFTSFEDAKGSTKRLCGASLTASAIRGFLEEKQNKTRGGNFNVFGMGLWHPRDDNYLEQLFKEDKLEKANPFRICSPDKIEIDDKDKRLFNLAREGDVCATTRVVRTFIGHIGTMPKSMSRYDWHLEWKPSVEDKDKKKSLKEIIKDRLSENLSKIKEIATQFDALVVADFNKGLIDRNLILSLVDEMKILGLSHDDMVWFYRSKHLEPPDWYEDFSSKMGKSDKFVQFIGPRISKKFAEGKKLIYGKEITAEGLEFLDIYAPEHITEPKLAALFHDNSFIAYNQKKEKKDSEIWVLESNEPPPYLTRGRSSIFLASLVILELPEKKRKLLDLIEGTSFGENCAVALSLGINWCNKCLDVWRKGDGNVMKVSGNIKEAITDKDIDSCSNKKMRDPLILEKVNQTWKQARSKKEYCCFLSDQPEPHYRLEVWRAHTVLNDYTVLDDKRKENVLNLTRAVRTFIEIDDKDKKRPLISLVKASPGSGKTFLAKCLAKNFDLELLECNVAQQTSLEGIIHFFDQVDTAQRDGRKIFMFMDEVDSLVNGESTFGFLLEMMWCGQYYRNGMKNTLKPFPGIFAMSRNDEEQNFKRDHPKYPDLISRIFGIHCKLKNFTPEESIYLFAKLLDKYFGQIAYVEMGVLKTICDTDLKYGPRSLELLISIFKGIKRNKITIENLPDDNRIRELSEHFPGGLAKPSIYRTNERQLVRIIYNPPL